MWNYQIKRWGEPFNDDADVIKGRDYLIIHDAELTRARDYLHLKRGYLKVLCKMWYFYECSYEH